MAIKSNSLELVIRNAKGVKGETNVISCGAGLELWVTINQSGQTAKKWNLRYTDAAGKRQKARIGSYPELSLAKARAEAEDLKANAKSGVNVAKAKAREKLPQVQSTRTFEAVATAWLQKKMPEWDDAHAKRQKERLVGNIFPAFGDVAINDLTMEHIDNALAVVIARGGAGNGATYLLHRDQCL